MQEIIEDDGGKVYLQKSDMSLIDEIHIGDQIYGSAYTMRHDIFVELNGRSFILDTKYKGIERFEGDTENALRVVREEPSQSDINQVCEYARKRGLSDVYLLYPQYRYEDVDNVRPRGVSLSHGNGLDINIHFVRLPFIFEEDENLVKTNLCKVIKEILTI